VRICLVTDAVIPVFLYGGTERVLVCLGRALRALGHEVTFLAGAGSRCDFAPLATLDPRRPLDAQVPAGTDLVHVHTPAVPMPEAWPACLTVYGNTSAPYTFPPNTVFVSERHARCHNARAFVHLGVDDTEYGPPRLDGVGDRFVFLGKAAWRLKNVRGAIRVARGAGRPLDVLGGTRLNFRMGFRLTLDRNARFHGMVGGERKNALLRGARGLLFPVLWEEPGATAVVESLYFGLPVFGTPYGCLPELVPSLAGALSDSESALIAAAAEADRYDRRAIHAWWREHLSARRMAEKYVVYYERILSGEPLHPGPIPAPAVKRTALHPWRP
jgi:glycosyltransferase involved in cell wall biosynthesis